MTPAEELLAQALSRQHQAQSREQWDAASLMAVMNWYLNTAPTRLEVAEVLAHAIDLLVEESKK